MPVAEFVEAMLRALAADLYEAAIVHAEGMKAKREALFETVNR